MYIFCLEKIVIESGEIYIMKVLTTANQTQEKKPKELMRTPGGEEEILNDQVVINSTFAVNWLRRQHNFFSRQAAKRIKTKPL